MNSNLGAVNNIPLTTLIECLIVTPATREKQWEQFHAWFERIDTARQNKDLAALKQVAYEMAEYQCPDFTDSNIHHNWQVIITMSGALYDLIIRQELYNKNKEETCQKT